MRCELCQKRKATIHIQEIIDGERKSLHLCASCATERRVGLEALKEFSLADFLSQVADATDLDEVGLDDEAAWPGQSIECPQCGMCGTTVQEKGRFGCAACYDAFADVLPEWLEVLHGTNQHIEALDEARRRAADRSAEARPEAGNLSQDVLRQELEDAVAIEDYERAADLRDRLARAEDQPETDDDG